MELKKERGGKKVRTKLLEVSIANGGRIFAEVLFCLQVAILTWISALVADDGRNRRKLEETGSGSGSGSRSGVDPRGLWLVVQVVVA